MILTVLDKVYRNSGNEEIKFHRYHFILSHYSLRPHFWLLKFHATLLTRYHILLTRMPCAAKCVRFHEIFSAILNSILLTTKVIRNHQWDPVQHCSRYWACWWPSTLVSGAGTSAGTATVVYVHYGDVIMGAIASQIPSLTIVYLTVYLDANQRKHQISASLAFVRGSHRWPVNFQHKWPVTWKMFQFHDVIMHEPTSDGFYR